MNIESFKNKLQLNVFPQENLFSTNKNVDCEIGNDRKNHKHHIQSLYLYCPANNITIGCFITV